MKKYVKYLLWLAALAPLLLLRDYTPDNELRYLSIADEALRDGHLFAFYNQGEAYADKPPLYLWLLMAVRTLTGGYNMLLLGLFSVVPASVVLEVMDRWAARELSPAYRLTAQMALFTTAYFIGGAVVLRMDMLMAMFIVLALRVFWRMYEGHGRKRDPWLLALWVFLALFTKGPFGVMIPVAAILVFLLAKGRLRTVGRYLGWRFWLVLLVLCGAWFGCVYAEGGRAYLDNLLFNQTVNRAVDSFSHKKGFFFYFETFGFAFAPWCLLYVVMLVTGVWKRWVRTDAERFFLTVFCTTLAMLSCISAKLEIYLLPAYPFLAYFSVMMLQRLEDGRRWNGWFSVPVLLPALVLVVSLPAVWALARRVDALAMLDAVPVYAGAAVMMRAGVYALFVLYRQKSLAKAVCTVATGLLCGVFVVSFFVPGINSEIGYGHLAGKGAELSEKYGIRQYYSYDVKRASGMEVYLGKDVEETTWEELQFALSGGERAIVFVRNRSLRNQEPLRELLAGKEQYAVGRYTVVVW